MFTYPHKGEPYAQAGGMANHVMRLFLDPADGTASQLRGVPMTLPDGTTKGNPNGAANANAGGG